MNLGAFPLNTGGLSNHIEKETTSSSSVPQPSISTLDNFTSDYTYWLWSKNFTPAQIPIISPLTTLLGEFFSHLRSRRLLSCTMSLAAGLVIPKNLRDIERKILSVPSHGGVWDEMLSIEDPDGFDKNFFPNALLVDPTLMIGRKLQAPDVQDNGTPSVTFKDLSVRISSATWLVYAYELRRADNIIRRYIYGEGVLNFENEKTKMKKNKAIFLEDNMKRLVQMLNILFEENPETRYRIPAALSIDKDSELTNRKFEVDGCSNDFFVVLLDGKLMIMKLAKICADRDGWWSHEFLSRRDVR